MLSQCQIFTKITSFINSGTTKQSALYYEFDQLQLRELKLSIDMKTVHMDGIIFYVTHQPQGRDFMALYLKDSEVTQQ